MMNYIVEMASTQHSGREHTGSSWEHTFCTQLTGFHVLQYVITCKDFTTQHWRAYGTLSLRLLTFVGCVLQRCREFGHSVFSRSHTWLIPCGQFSHHYYLICSLLDLLAYVQVYYKFLHGEIEVPGKDRSDASIAVGSGSPSNFKVRMQQ